MTINNTPSMYAIKHIYKKSTQISSINEQSHI